MAGQVVQPLWRSLQWMMGQPERPHLPALLLNLNASFFVTVPWQYIMVAPDQGEIHRAKLADQLTQVLPFRIVVAVKQIAQEENPVRFQVEEQTVQAIPVGIRGSSGNRDSRTPKMPHFPQVQVCQEQSLLLLPEDGFKRVQYQRLVMYVKLTDLGIHSVGFDPGEITRPHFLPAIAPRRWMRKEKQILRPFPSPGGWLTT